MERHHGNLTCHMYLDEYIDLSVEFQLTILQVSWLTKDWGMSSLWFANPRYAKKAFAYLGLAISFYCCILSFLLSKVFLCDRETYE